MTKQPIGRRPVTGALALAGLIAGSAMTVAATTAMAQTALERIVVALPEEPASLDPCDTNHSANSRVLRNNVTETLVNISTTDGTITPNLATSWEQLSPTTWRLRLRSGVRFQDGAPFNAAAAARAIERAQIEALNCAIRGSKLGSNPYTARAIDDLTLEVVGRNPDPIVPYRMAIVDIGSPTGTPQDAKTQRPVGTGPYRLANWNRGQDIVLEANPNYWGTKPQMTQVRFVWRGESAVRAAMVDRGEAHMAFAIAPQDAKSPLDKSYQNGEATFIRLDTEIAPLNDIRVRKAANLAIDRQALIGTIFHKDVGKSTQMILPNVNGHSPDIEVWPFDLAQARRLLAEAKADGVPVDREIVLYGRLGLYPNSTESVEAIQAMLNTAGFKVRVEMMEVQSWLKKLLKPFDNPRQPNMLQSQHDNTQGDAVFTIAPKFRSDGNQSTLTDRIVDDMIDLGTASTGALRRNAYRMAFEYMQKNIIPTIELFYMVGTVRVARNVTYEPDNQANNEIKLAAIRAR